MKEYDYLIVGAGFAGSVLAERFASINKKVLIIDIKNHIGGNCYDYIDDNGIIIQKYGPHIFHTKNKEVFDYLSKFVKWNNYKHKVLSFFKGNHYVIPINLETINKFFNINLKDEEELKKFLEQKRINITEIKNSRDVVVSKLGEELYEAFIKEYTKKQWDKYPDELDKIVLERLPIKYDNDPYFFLDLYQGMPIGGFTKLFENMLNKDNITIKLECDFFKIKDKVKFKNLIYTGKIDEFFNNKFGKLKYRCIDFTFEKHKLKSFQPNSVVNFPENNFKFSRITEFKKFYNNNNNNNNNCEDTIICKEFFNWSGEPCYPVMDKENIELSNKYLKELKENNIFFLGRLATYKYINIDQVVKDALDLFNNIKDI